MSKLRTLFCVSGHSGSGKTSLMRSAMGQRREVISLTTREKRDGEMDGYDYYFIEQQEMKEYLDNDELVEFTQYYNSPNMYGIHKEELMQRLKYANAYAIVDFEGLQHLKAYYPNVVSIFLYTDKEEAEKRMLERGDDKADIEVRLSNYEKEMLTKSSYDYVIKNAKFGNTMQIIENIILGESKINRYDKL